MTQQDRAVIEALISEIEALDRALTIEQAFNAAIRRLLVTKGHASAEELETQARRGGGPRSIAGDEAARARGASHGRAEALNDVLAPP
jgi:hypothetical protein